MTYIYIINMTYISGVNNLYNGVNSINITMSRKLKCILYMKCRKERF